MKARSTLLALLPGLLTVCPVVLAATPQPPASPAAESFFESRVRPVLASQCGSCHGPDRQLSGLRLDSRTALLKGGAHGAAVVPGHPEQSLLVEALRYQHATLKMPPGGKLADAQIRDVEQWVRSGAVFPMTSSGRPDRPELDPVLGRSFWAFQAPHRPAIPVVKDRAWVKTPIDAFVLSGLEAQGLRPNPEADCRTLLRRATYDLTGLPPTEDEIRAFQSDRSPGAWERVVDRLLASPSYGERWGRHWLDVARYADSNGLDENVAYANAWRYRDYVVNAFNADKPFDRFLTEQLAGDLLPETDPDRSSRLIATGFLSLGPKVLAEVDDKKMEMDIVDEQIDTVGRAFMGLTLGCARCHDHKFDPIKTDDYYALAGIFKSTRTMDKFIKPAVWHENDLGSPEEHARKAESDGRIADVQRQIKEATDRANAALKKTLPPGKSLPSKPEPSYPAETRSELESLRSKLTKEQSAAPVLPSALGVDDGTPTNVAIHIRGSYLTLGPMVSRHFPVVLVNSGSAGPDVKHSGRLELARWLTAPEHPLTSRVIANRVWRWHFGQGIVRSTDNFGHLGELPANQPLLDWMATAFVSGGVAGYEQTHPHTPALPHTHTIAGDEQHLRNCGCNWSLKKLHRLIMLSNTYRMSSAWNARSAKVDPENRMHWRSDVQRLEAEEVRDALLAVSGELDRTMGGTLLPLKNREYVFDHTSTDRTKYDSRRRSLYLPVIRNHVYDVFQLFDFPDPAVEDGNRATTTVAPQALFLLNSELVANAAQDLAANLDRSGDTGDSDRMQHLYLRALGRPPTAEETSRAATALTRFQALATANGATPADAKRKAWSWLCQTVLAANEFVYLR